MGSTKIVVERETIETVTNKGSFETITNKRQGSFSLSSEDAMSSSETDRQTSSPLLGGDEESLAQQPLTTTLKKKKLELLPLIFLIYFEVSGGAYGEEASVGAAGPLLAILGFTIFPFIWSMPEALVTAELATTFPGNGGYVIWAERAFGPFWGSMMGSWKFLSGVINLASYPVLCIDYLKAVWPAMSSGIPRYVAISTATVVLSFVNYTGISIVGYAAVVMGLASLSPFVVLTLWSIPKIHPSRWSSLGQKGVTKNWSAFFNILFWNLNFWDNASTLAGEVENPQITYPKALFSAGILTCLAYLVPLLAVTGAIPLTNQQDWIDGYFAEAAQTIAGKWLKIWMEIGAILSSIGLFQAQLSSCAYQFLGMADLGMLPRGFGSRARHFNTPWVGILVSASIALAISYLDFSDIVASVNFLYSLGMLLEFASFIWLRKKLPKINRPYRVPMGIPGLVAMCLIPSGFLIYVMTVGSRTMYVVSGSLTALGVGWYFLMRICESNNWVEFNDDTTTTTTVNKGEGLVTLDL